MTDNSGDAERVDSNQAESEGPNTDRQYHLELTSDDVADSVLLPGNPERIATITDCWDEAEPVASHREYRTATGSYDGTPISATSTGIGGPSAAIALEELARVDASTFIRVGSCGAIQPEIELGDLVITSGAVRQEGTSTEYINPEYPAVADQEVLAALVAAAERLGYDYHVGLTMSADSFYTGQGRPGFEGYEAPGSDSLLDELRNANVANIEMEAATILTLASIYGLRAGAVCAVYANRSTGEFRTEGDGRAAETASLAVALLAKMDRIKRKQGVDVWHAGLSLDHPS